MVEFEKGALTSVNVFGHAAPKVEVKQRMMSYLQFGRNRKASSSFLFEYSPNKSGELEKANKLLCIWFGPIHMRA